MKEPPVKEPSRFHFRKPENSWQEKLSKFLLLFYVSSFAGWIWEVILFLFKENRFVNRGFLYGPWLPIYGIGSIVLLFFLGHFRKKPVLVFTISALGGGALEYITGWWLDHFYGLKYWDYSNMWLNLHGYTCLPFMLVFGVAGTFWVCFLSHRITGGWMQLQEYVRRWIIYALSAVFLADCLLSAFFPNTGKGITF